MGEPAGKYAQFELERRFLVGRMPEGLGHARSWSITDRYVKNTRLRLRLMEPLQGGKAIYKFGQKYVPSPPDFSRTVITNLYLSSAEYAALAELEAHELHKVRHQIEDNDRLFTVDVFDGPLLGLVLAEQEYTAPEEMDRPLDLPPWVIGDVSEERRFTGGVLAALTPGQAAELIRQIAPLAL